jgi:hypothetical protein
MAGGPASASPGALGSAASIAKLQSLLAEKDISVALAVRHALVQLKRNSGYVVYYFLVVGVRKRRTSLVTEELNQMKTQERAIRFAFDQGIGFLPSGGCGRETLHAWRKRSTVRTRAAAARELAGDPDPHSGEALAKAVSDKDWTVRAAAVEAIATRGDSALLVDLKPGMSDRKEIVRYSAAAAVLRLSRIAQQKEVQFSQVSIQTDFLFQKPARLASARITMPPRRFLTIGVANRVSLEPLVLARERRVAGRATKQVPSARNLTLFTPPAYLW